MKKKNNAPKSEKRKKTRKNHEMGMVTYLFTGLFALLIGYLVYFDGVLREDVINNPYNSRQETFAEQVIRGKILSNDGTVLAETRVGEDGEEIRSYPFGDMFAHAVGYASHGRTGVEALGNFSLLTSNAFLPERITKEIKEEKNLGDNLITTLDVDLQRAAYAALGSQRGAIVAIEPSTGKILCMVSKPDFDPNQIGEKWETWNGLDSADSVLYNRVTQGLYAPGSVFKVVTLLDDLRENPQAEDTTFHCSGSLTQGNYTISCYRRSAHGTQSLQKAFAHSCNTAFAQIGLELDPTAFGQTCKSLLFGVDLPVDLPYSRSSFALTGQASEDEKMMTAIGQGQTMVSPMHMALITASIANKGVLMEPYLIDHIESYTGDQVRAYRPKAYGSLMTDMEAGKLTEYMRQVVESGTAKTLNNLPVTVAGKTGSAEYSSDKTKSHAWFIGFSMEEEKDLAVCVLVEGAGSGGEYAVPIARRLFEVYYS